MRSLISFFILTLTLSANAQVHFPLFNGSDLEGLTVMNDAEFAAEDGVLTLVDGMGWLRTDQIYDDFVLEWDCKPLVENFDSGIYFRASLEGEPWPDEGWQINLRYDNLGTLVRGVRPFFKSDVQSPAGEWVSFRLQAEGETASLKLNGEEIWEADFIDPPMGLIGIQAEKRQFEFRNMHMVETGYDNLLEGEGREFEHLAVHAGDKDAWRIDENGVLVCEGQGGGWIGTKTGDYGDFVFKFDFWVPKEGNSGVYIRRPLEGDGAYSGMEIQIIDDDAKHWGQLADWQLCGSIYHEVSPSVRATREAGQWQTMAIVADGADIDIYINGIQMVDADLDEYDTSTTDAKPLKERPRSGYLGFQNYDGSIKYRNARVKRLD